MTEKGRNSSPIIAGSVKKRYSLFTFVLIACIAELAASSAGNINKNIHFQSKIQGLENKLNEEKAKNEQLKSQIQNFNSNAVLEAISRNNLKMAGENEILLIIHKPKNSSVNLSSPE